MDAVQTIALALGVGWASGINLYAAVGMLGLLGVTGNIALPPDLLVLQEPIVIGAALVMYMVEFFADKVPGVDTTWDAIHSFVRIPAGAILAAGAIGDVTPAAELAAGLLGGGLAATSHATKAGSRALLNVSPEPVTNWTASVAEDALVVGGLWAALHNPVLFLIGLAVFVLLAIWMLPKIARGIARSVGRVRAWLRGEPPPPTDAGSVTVDSYEPARDASADPVRRSL